MNLLVVWPHGPSELYQTGDDDGGVVLSVRHDLGVEAPGPLSKLLLNAGRASLMHGPGRNYCHRGDEGDDEDHELGPAPPVLIWAYSLKESHGDIRCTLLRISMGPLSLILTEIED